jgi:hypothetical protein
MERRVRTASLVAAFALFAAAGCEEAPTTPDALAPPDAGAAQAANAGQAISGTLFVSDVLARPDESVTPGGTTRYRGTVFVATLTGDVEGEFTSVQTSNWNKYLNGALKGEAEGTVTWNGRTGGISGTIVLPLRDGVLYGDWVFHGDGELAGHKLQMKLNGPLGCPPTAPCDYTGFVRVPASAQ